MMTLGAAAQFVGLLLIFGSIYLVIDAQASWDGKVPEEKEEPENKDDPLEWRRAMPYDAMGDYSFLNDTKQEKDQE